MHGDDKNGEAGWKLTRKQGKPYGCVAICTVRNAIAQRRSAICVAWSVDTLLRCGSEALVFAPALVDHRDHDQLDDLLA